MGEQLVLLQQQKQPWHQPYYAPPMGIEHPMFCPPGYPMGPPQQVGPPQGGQSSGNCSTPSQQRSKFQGRYCWSCGACDHWGNKCPAKKPGHINKASFKDKKGGSTANCRTAWRCGTELSLRQQLLKLKGKLTPTSSAVPPDTRKPSIWHKAPFTVPKIRPQSTVIAKIDSGASKNYFRECDQHVLNNIVNVKGPKVLSGCWALVNKYWMNIDKDKYRVLQGLRNWRDGLWDIELPVKLTDVALQIFL